jgi:hypothetical protein
VLGEPLGAGVVEEPVSVAEPEAEDVEVPVAEPVAVGTGVVTPVGGAVCPVVDVVAAGEGVVPLGSDPEPCGVTARPMLVPLPDEDETGCPRIVSASVIAPIAIANATATPVATIRSGRRRDGWSERTAPWTSRAPVEGWPLVSTGASFWLGDNARRRVPAVCSEWE